MHPPLYLAYAASYLRSRGHQVDLIDASALSMSVSHFTSQVEKISPEFLVFETSTPSFNNDSLVAREIAKRIDTKIVFLGTHVSARPKDSLEQSAIDAVIRGEYEISLAEYIEQGPLNTKGVCYKTDNGEIIINPPREYIENLDALPFPARDLLPNHKYFDPILKNPFTFILAGRGCPHRCTFCNWPQTLTGHRYRFRSATNIIDEIEQILKDYKFKSFLFNDDTLMANKENLRRLCQEIKRRDIKIKWGCYIRPNEKDEELLELMQTAGCYLLKVGIESGNQAILDGMKKNCKIEDIRQGITLMKKKGFHIHATFIFGMPGENNSTIRQTIDFAKELNPTTTQFSTAVPYPGTEFYEYLEREGLFITKNWDNFMPIRPIYQYPNLNTRQILSWLRRAYREYYFRPKYIWIGGKKLFTQPRVLWSSLKKLISLTIKPLEK